MSIELPQTFLEQMKTLLKEEYDAFRESFKEERLYGLRVNTAKLSPGEFARIAPFPLKEIPWIPNGFYYEGDKRPARDPYYYAGLYYLQEPSAMTPANLLPVQPGNRVLDLCAAPGGKSTELAARLSGEGVLVSNDISNSRAKALLKNLELFGITNAVILSEAPHRLAERFPGYFDRILIDAPCSGEGMFRKDPSVIRSWQEHGNAYFVKLQKEISAQAVKMLAPGGMLLYSTCTFSPLEDEQIAAHILSLDPELSLVQPAWSEGFDTGRPEWADGNPDLAKCVRIWPHKMKGEGHFIALFQKNGDAGGSLPAGRSSGLYRNAGDRRPGVSASLPEELKGFLDTLSVDWDLSRITLRQERAQLEPEAAANLSGLRVLRSGLLVGECRKNRFEPAQALAMALKPGQFPDIISFSHEDPRVIRYLKGETIEADHAASGLQLICVDGYPLGFGKASGTTIKNKYLAGWRWM